MTHTARISSALALAGAILLATATVYQATQQEPSAGLVAGATPAKTATAALALGVVPSPAPVAVSAQVPEVPAMGSLAQQAFQRIDAESAGALPGLPAGRWTLIGTAGDSDSAETADLKAD